jgi:hypothetical protein
VGVALAGDALACRRWSAVDAASSSWRRTALGPVPLSASEVRSSRRRGGIAGCWLLVDADPKRRRADRAGCPGHVRKVCPFRHEDRLLGVDGDLLVRDLLEVVIVVAVGGMLVSAVRALRRGQIKAFVCPSCGRPTTRANGSCKHCGAPVD